MTRRKERLPLESTNIRLFAGDMERLCEYYPRVGANKVIRELVHQHLRSIEEAVRAAVPAPRITIDD